VVKILIGRTRKFQCTKADVVKCFVIDAECRVSIFYKLVNREGRVVRLGNCVRHLRRWHYAVTVHHTIGIFLTNLRDEQCTHPGAGATTKGVCELEALETVTSLGLLTHHIDHGVSKLRPLCVVSLCPVVAGTILPCRCLYVNVVNYYGQCNSQSIQKILLIQLRFV
jgi:hypothetical protein